MNMSLLPLFFTLVRIFIIIFIILTFISFFFFIFTFVRTFIVIVIFIFLTLIFLFLLVFASIRIFVIILILTVRTAFVNHNKPTGESPGLRGHKWSLANHVAGVDMASESVWVWGPVQGRTSSSLQASATPPSGLSDTQNRGIQGG